MLYIAIPPGYRLEVRKAENFLVSDEEAPISLEAEVRAYFDKSPISLSILENFPPLDSCHYVEYCPIDAGRKKSEWVHLIEGVARAKELLRGGCPQKFTLGLPFETAFKEQKEADALMRLENKRHLGDSPWAT